MSKRTVFHSLQVSQIDQTTEDCALISFEVPASLREAFAYKQGQYLTVKADINGEEVRRSYSLCSSPLDDSWRIGVKKVPMGKFSTFANEVLQAGDTLEVMPPNGRFFVEVDKNQQRNYVAFAAGSGITPIFSIIDTHLRAEPKATFKLFYINRTVGSIILKEELEALKNQYMDRLEIFHFLTQQHRDVPLFNGRLTEEKLAIIFNVICEVAEIDEYFVCGPEAMIFLVRDFLVAQGVDTHHIHFELFGTGGGSKVAIQPTAEQIGQQTQLTIIEGGKSMHFAMPMAANNILDAALNQQADLPFACKGGVCCTCRAKLVEGEVKTILNYGLEEDEIEAGYILTCQAIPLSAQVTVDFDA